MSRGLELAILGAAGLNGENLIQVIQNSSLPIAQLHLLDSNAHLGRNVDAGGKLLPLSDYADYNYQECDLALVCEDVPVSVIEQIRAQGCTLIAPGYLLPDADTALTLADVNSDQQGFDKGMAIAVPPARAAVIATLLSPLHDEQGVTAVNAVWFCSVSSDGRHAVEGLAGETAQLLNGQKVKARVYDEKVAFNLLARDASSEEAGLTTLWRELWGEELQASVSTAVAPLFFGDLLSLTVELEQECDEEAFASILSAVDDIDIANSQSAVTLSGADVVGEELLKVGDIRRVDQEGRRYTFWVAVDTQRFGLAYNLTKITQALAKKLFISYS